MELQEETGLKIELPNGKQVTLPDFCENALAAEIVTVPTKHGDKFVVAMKVLDQGRADELTTRYGGDVYGVACLGFNADGEYLNDHCVQWGLVSSEEADLAFEHHLWSARYEAKVFNLGLEMALSQHVNADTGQYVGQVLDVDQGLDSVFVAGGRGAWASLPLWKFDQAPEVGEKIDIKCSEGKILLNGPKVVGEIDLGR